MRERLLSAAWALLLLLLPVTSMPLVQKIVRSSTVASPSLLLLALMLALWLLPYLLRRGHLPGAFWPLGAFTLAALISWVASFFLGTPSYKDVSVISEGAQAFITLAIGLAYYLVSSTWVSSSGRLQATLRWINIAGLLIIVWSAAQAAAWFSANRYPGWMRDFHDLLSLGPLYRQRVTGFALEPSWLAHQLNMLYLPVWLAATVRGISAHSRRVLGISFENVLLLGGVATMALTLSRVGFLAFLAMLAFLLLRLAIWLVRRIQGWLAARIRSPWLEQPAGRALITAAIVTALLVVSLAAAFGGLYVFSKVDPRMANVYDLIFLRDSGFAVYANRLQFGERVVYWQAGWNIFEQYPLLGVGLGNAGFYFTDALPPNAWQLSEVRRLMWHAGGLLNTKNLWARLLSETGIAGFAFFISWLYLVFISARSLLRRAMPLQVTMGYVGIFVLLALIFEGFSIDSFAMPYWWVSLGLVTAAFRLPPGPAEKANILGE